MSSVEKGYRFFKRHRSAKEGRKKNKKAEKKKKKKKKLRLFIFD